MGRSTNTWTGETVVVLVLIYCGVVERLALGKVPLCRLFVVPDFYVTTLMSVVPSS